MEAIRPPKRLDYSCDDQDGVRPEGCSGLDSPEVWPELDALLEKTNRLEQLVTQLSRLVARTVGDGP
jgi:hypothetical protein